MQHGREELSVQRGMAEATFQFVGPVVGAFGVSLGSGNFFLGRIEEVECRDESAVNVDLETNDH